MFSDARAPAPLVRIEDGSLGPDGQVRLVVSGVSDPRPLHRSWASSGAVLEVRGHRLRATTTAQALARAAGRALRADEAAGLERSLTGAIDSWRGPAPPVPLPDGRTLALGERPAVVGVVNVTRDSFSDGGRIYPGGHPEAGLAHSRQLLNEGADIIDVGGESTRPGSESIDLDEERHRVLPILERLAAAGVTCSVDTTKAELAREATAAGAQIVNDVSGARDPALLEAVAASGAAYVLMHTRGTPADMQSRTDYEDVVAEVYEFLATGLDRCAAAGIPPDRVLVDPGIGFAKTAEQNLSLLRALRQFRGLGRAVLVGASRKSFLGPLSAAPGSAEPSGPDGRLVASLACVALAVEAGAAALRVHDVAASLRAARLGRAVATGRQDWSPIVNSAGAS